MDFISIIMPSHNSSEFITESVNSVLSQSHTSLELIVIDDGSTDNTVNLIKQLAKTDQRIILLERTTCSNRPATPRNEGVKIARGDYLAFIDSDDLWHPQKISLQLAAMDTHKLNFISSFHIRFSKIAPDFKQLPDQPEEIIKQSHANLIRKNNIITSSSLIKRDFFGNLQFDQSDEYSGIEDYLAWLNLHQKEETNSGILAMPLVHYRLRPNSYSSSKIMMAKKIFYLLNNYEYRGNKLGLRKYFYFMTYALLAIKNRLSIN